MRFTPTCVGTIWDHGEALNAITVHPHMHGDNAADDVSQVGRVGSPPHAWGQSICSAGRSCARRFTPTCVGTISAASTMNIYTAVHPHMRGDNITCFHSTGIQNGSPPHAWGQCGNVR